jgi:hypothetical protein
LRIGALEEPGRAKKVRGAGLGQPKPDAPQLK